MTNHKSSKRYSDDFRKIMVDFYHSGQSVRNLSSEYGVFEVTIYVWIIKIRPISVSQKWEE